MQSAAKLPGERFLALGEVERQFWYEGAFRSLAHLISQYDRSKGDCVSQWWLRDRKGKQALIEKELRRDPKSNETTTVLALLTLACGELTPKKAIN